MDEWRRPGTAPDAAAPAPAPPVTVPPSDWDRPPPLVAVPASSADFEPAIAAPVDVDTYAYAGDESPEQAAAVEPRAAGVFADLLRAPLALIAVSVVVTLAASCFFVAEAIDLSDAGDVGGAAHLTGTILVAASNLVLALALAWIVVLLGRRSG
jgi:hypothetical protein